MTYRICISHTADITKELKHLGIWYLVRNDREKTRQFAAAWLRGEARKEDFDPFVIFTLEVFKKAAILLGKESMNGGERCPLCLANAKFYPEYQQDIAAKWIEDGCYLMRLTAQNNGLALKDSV